MIDPYQEQRTLGWKPLGVLAIAFCILAIASPNPFLTLTSLAAMAVIVQLLWRPGEPPVLLFAMAYHWVQACVLTLDANLRGLTLEEMASSLTITQAAWLSLLGVLFVTLGIKAGARKNLGVGTQNQVAAQASRLSVRRLFIASLVAIPGSTLISSTAHAIPALTQPILALSLLHWVIVYLFTYAVLAQKRGYAALSLVFGIELVVGFMGYFSGFKNVLFVMLLAALAAPSALRGVRFRTAAGISVVVVTLSLVWIAIKRDYRVFLNMGTGDQVVLVPVEKRIGKLGELIGELTPGKFVDSLEALSDRLTYVGYFGESIKVVPDVIPHEDGRLWREAIENVLVPRFLNPDKRSINDSERTAYYTGGWVAGIQEGTSISLGYIAESYIDFGPLLMFIPLFLWGLFVGFSHRILVRSTRFPLLGYANAAILVCMNAAVLETSNIKMVGGMVMGLLVLLLVQKYFAQRLLSLLSLPAKEIESAAA